MFGMELNSAEKFHIHEYDEMAAHGVQKHQYS